jgi:hypothetical protein
MPTVKKYFVALTVAVAVFAFSAFAASLEVNAGTLQAGHDTIDECITEDVDVSYVETDFVEGEWVVGKIELDLDQRSVQRRLMPGDYRVVVTGDNELESGPQLAARSRCQGRPRSLSTRPSTPRMRRTSIW